MMPVNVKNFPRKFTQYPKELTQFCGINKVDLPGIDTLRGQAIAIMSQPGVRGEKYMSRKECTEFFDQIGMSTKDSIQPFNKAIGLKTVGARGQYTLAYPFVSDTVDIDKRKGVSIDGDRDTEINKIKSWWKQNLVDVPNSEWQVGHLDPTTPDASAANLAYQPPIQGKYRDRFKFDPFFIRMWPTGNELTKQFNAYYTEKERRMIYEALQKEFQ